MKVERLRLFNVSFKRRDRKQLLNVWCPTATDVMSASRWAAREVRIMVQLSQLSGPYERYVEYGISRLWVWRYTFDNGTVNYSQQTPGELHIHGYSNVDGSRI